MALLQRRYKTVCHLSVLCLLPYLWQYPANNCSLGRSVVKEGRTVSSEQIVKDEALIPTTDKALNVAQNM